ncbi:hypothetical protein Bhyg_09756 [Pseudolycoriella hygida]|uniref:Uncharacterized protein n=1 Tax=Pseudolycoriella hygida TaxID=35572 RepID=A0A9Q0MS46_9DIPT|nr:hypothetical protein Bhyg_09756 [Pseudolycoriella hygida]
MNNQTVAMFLFFRRRVHQVLESGVTRHTRCVVDVVDPPITFKSQRVHSVDILRPNCAHTIGPLRLRGERPLEPVVCATLKLFVDDSAMASVKVVKLSLANRTHKL